MADRHANYYEGILQLRNADKDVIRFVETWLSGKKVGVAKTVRLKTGIDFYVASNKALLQLGRVLQKTFGGEVKRSSKLFSVDRQRSTKVYRGTVLFRMPGFRKGDRISFRGEEYVVSAIGAKIWLKHAVSGRKKVISYADVTARSGKT